VTNCETEEQETKEHAKSQFFSQNDLATIDKDKIPHHVAIIPDGNRRWAKDLKKESLEGYPFGIESGITCIRAAKELGIKVLTVYTFSTENWGRPKAEVLTYLKIVEGYLRKYQQKLIDYGIRFNVIGNLELLPSPLVHLINESKEVTKHCTDFDLVLAVNYGSRDEICRAVRKIVNDCLTQKISPDTLTEESIAHYLDTSRWPDPDLLIRTSGEKRVSNFLLWQSSYTELYTDEVLWPDFTPSHLLSAVCDYQSRQRRRGGGTYN